jgi:predicted ATP-binding protein involved in virulence
LLSNGYTEKEINDMITFSGFSINDTLLEQIANDSESIKQVKDLPFPEAIPYFKVISKQTYETSNNDLKKANMTPQEYHLKHLERIGKHAKYEILDGTHFIYLNNADRIAEITDDLLLKVN